MLMDADVGEGGGVSKISQKLLTQFMDDHIEKSLFKNIWRKNFLNEWILKTMLLKSFATIHAARETYQILREIFAPGNEPLYGLCCQNFYLQISLMQGAIPWYLGLLSWRLFNKTARNKDHRCKQGCSLTMGRGCPLFGSHKGKNSGHPTIQNQKGPKQRGIPKICYYAQTFALNKKSTLLF